MRFLDVLMDEHRGFSAMLDVLDAVAARLGRGREVPVPMIADVLEFFGRFADRHHDREEALLFPLLARHGIGSDQTVVSALMAQHEAGRVYGSKMKQELKRLQQGDPAAAAALADDAQAYSELIREHIRIEDEYFYKLADQVLNDAEHDAILRQFRGPDSRQAHDERARYLHMLEVYPAVVAGWREGH
jgi:hemerythrin-like domain-containing protein